MRFTFVNDRVSLFPGIMEMGEIVTLSTQIKPKLKKTPNRVIGNY